MTYRVACIVIAGGQRTKLLDTIILPPITAMGFDEVVVVGTHHPGDGYRYLHVPAVLGTTTDALIKRETGAVATSSDVLVYLSDDHALDPMFLPELRAHLAHGRQWDAAAPARFTYKDGEPIPLNMGVKEGYIAGHGIVIFRDALASLPWMAGGHSRIWDVTHSQGLHNAGNRMAVFEGGVAIWDVERIGNPTAVPPWL